MIFLVDDDSAMVLEHVSHWRWSDDYRQDMNALPETRYIGPERALLVYMSSGVPFRFVGETAFRVQRLLHRKLGEIVTLEAADLPEATSRPEGK